jgi:hypothetical protein
MLKNEFNLTGKLPEAKKEKAEKLMIGSIKVVKTNNGKTRKMIQEVYSKYQHSLSYAPETISAGGRKYTLNYPLRCLFEKEGNYYAVNNELLDIIGTGLSREEAEENFNEEFDYLYVRLNSLDDARLSDRLLRIKLMLNCFVKTVQ